ncbi:MAG: ABC transporter permease [Pirellulales bacterium]|nr:ABC transporter permease [Pirellulales bacterium]
MLLCLRYLRTRYIALASIISVTLGVATMIVVNSVMSGFTTEMRDRLKGIISDVVVEPRSLSGFPDPEAHMKLFREVAGDSIEAMTPTVVVPAMLSFQYRGEWTMRQVQLIGIDEATQSQVSDFGKYLQHPANRQKMSFELRPGGYDARDHQSGPEAPVREDMRDAGWGYRRRMAEEQAFLRPAELRPVRPASHSPGGSAFPLPPPPEVTPVSATEIVFRAEPPAPRPSPPEPAMSQTPQLPTPGRTNLLREGPEPPAAFPPVALPTESPVAPTPSYPSPAHPADPFASAAAAEQDEFDPAKKQHAGAVLGIALCSFRDHDGVDRFLIRPGDDVKLTFPNTGTPPKIISDNFTVVDVYESKMSEYDAQFVFVPIRKLQELRAMIDPTTDVRNVNAIQIKLRPGANGEDVRDRLRAALSPSAYMVSTWRDKQGPLLAAVQMETAILNVLLFLIIAVAGFGILAIFLMIVVEKTRDIGILKSLGASRSGIMGIFLGYGLSLGLVGSVAGLILGLWFTHNINPIADVLGRITGQPVFDPSIYYFYKIPTIVDPWTVGWIVFGAMGIAVLASILPALRAALLHPVEALRYE